MKKLSSRIAHAESSKRRTLRLTREAIRTLGFGALAAVNGGADCTSTSWTTEKKTQETQGTVSKAC